MSEIQIGRVVQVCVNRGTNGISTPESSIEIVAGYGIIGDSHYGLTRKADVREKRAINAGLPKKSEIFNNRQFSAISREEMEAISQAMGLQSIAFGLLGENLVVEGIPNFTQLPSGALLSFRNEVGLITANLMILSENQPCIVPARNIREANEGVEIAQPFQTSAIKKRGVVGIVYSSGTISSGNEIIVSI